jgi:Fe-S-cluster containining protein
MNDPLQDLLATAYGLRQKERQAATGILAKKKSGATLIELVDEAVGLAEMEICQVSMFQAACEAGCAWCCYQRVSASPAEVLRIVDYLRKTRTAEELLDLRQRLAATDTLTHGRTAQARLALRQPCPLLVDGQCSVYHVRPLVCRGYTSDNVEACQRKIDHPDQHVHVEADPIRYFYCQGVLNGLDDGLYIHKLEGGLVELIAALRIALDDARSLKRWLQGERIFADVQVAALPLVE